MSEYWLVKSNNGTIYLDKEGEWWLGGSSSLIWIPLFKDRKNAMKLARRVKRSDQGGIKWTKTIKAVIYD